MLRNHVLPIVGEVGKYVGEIVDEVGTKSDIETSVEPCAPEVVAEVGITTEEYVGEVELCGIIIEFLSSPKFSVTSSTGKSSMK